MRPGRRARAAVRRIRGRRGGAAGAAAGASSGAVADPLPVLPDFEPAATIRLVVGPANFAGQGYRWARAAAALPSVSAWSYGYETGSFAFPVDVSMSVPVYRSPEWAAAMLARMRADVTHALVEGMRPMLGVRYGNDCWGELPVLGEAGVRVALVCHGSEVRSPRRHSAWSPQSPFPDMEPALVGRMQERSDRNRAIADAFSGLVFVSTPDLLDDVPRGQWLPVVVDPSAWTGGPAALQRDTPRLLVAPTSSAIKGVAAVEDALLALERDGVVELVRPGGVPADLMPGLVASADIVVDQLRLGAYGVSAVEAMAAGRVVIGHVDERVRRRIDAQVPIVEATIATFGDVVREVVGQRDRYGAVAAAGPAYVAEVHDGRRSAAVLAPFLAAGPGAPAYAGG
jgi:hypothetical protein